LKKESGIKKTLRWLPGILISILASFFISKVVDFNVLVNSISDIGYKNILIIVVLTLISLAARAIAWMKLLPRVKFTDSFLLINESYLFNNLIPRSGELVKTILFSKPASEHAFTIFSSVIVERSLDLVIAASMFLVTFPFVSQLNNIRPIAFTLLILFLLFLLSGLLIALNAEKVKTWLRNIGKRNTNFMEKILPKIIGINTIQSDVKFWWAIFTEGVLALGIALPSAPAGLGVFEGTMIAALSVFGISVEKSLGIAVVIHLVQIILTTAIGLIAVMRQGESISDILRKIRSAKQKNAEEINQK